MKSLKRSLKSADGSCYSIEGTVSMTNNIYAAAWTEGSIYCYKRGCNCQGCYMNDLLESIPCRMKKAVLELVRKFGKPPENENELTKTQQKVIDAILAGCNDKISIAEHTGLSVTNVQDILSDLYKLAEFDGVVYKNLRYKLPDFIEWVRKGKEE